MRNHICRLIAVLVMAGCGDNTKPEPVEPPGTVIDTPPETLSATTHVQVTFHAVGGQATGFLCTLDTAAATQCASPWTFDVTDGAHSISIAALGADGVAGVPATAGFTVDTVAPDTEILTAPAAVETSSFATFSFAAAPAETGVTFECSVDGAPYAS